MVFRLIRKNRSFVTGSIAVILLSVLSILFLSSRTQPFAPHVDFPKSESQLKSLAIIPNYTLPFTFSRDHLIPPKIWQILLPHPNKPANAPFDAQVLVDTPSWLIRNPGYGYILIGQGEADDFVNTHFSGDTKILDAWRALRNPGVKSDLLRYLILFIEGGIYTDIDTEALKPIDFWVPEQYRNQAKVVIGIEWDQLNGGPWAEIPHRLQFCQWTIAAAPGHSLFMRMAYHAINALENLATEHSTTLGNLDPSSVEVMMSSGPASWTDIVLEQLKEMDPNVTDVTDFSGMKPTGPRLCGDILVLTIDGFGMGQPHSNSTNDGTIPEAALLKHKFRGSWRNGG
ncbi:alpha-1,6-mannosyltransferase Och1 [Xylaria cubensis]|nr:alpha-1,6-mannosyltransferase Och1 [Xylaria cubensis]